MTRWVYNTAEGLAEIVASPRCGYTLIFDGDALEWHASPHSAAEALANGTCSWPSFGDPSELGVPEEISGWRRAR